MFRRPIQKTPPSVYIWRFQSTHTCRRPAANGQKDPKKKVEATCTGQWAKGQEASDWQVANEDLPLTQWIMQVALQSEADDLEQWHFLFKWAAFNELSHQREKGDTWLSFVENLPHPMKRLVRTQWPLESGHWSATDREIFSALFPCDYLWHWWPSFVFGIGR